MVRKESDQTKQTNKAKLEIHTRLMHVIVWRHFVADDNLFFTGVFGV